MNKFNGSSRCSTFAMNCNRCTVQTTHRLCTTILIRFIDDSCDNLFII